MPSSNPTAPTTTGSAANDIWRQHEPQIRDLYQNKKKTLKEVKEEMEKIGFPKKPLSTWESKLRVDLRIRKKNKASHWPLVYRHLTPRLEKLGKKRLRQPTTIRLDGKEISFNEAWKEIRRSGAHILSPRLLPQGSLPCGIEVRTPSPLLSQRSVTGILASPVASVVPTTPGSTAALQLYAPQTTIGGSPPRITSAASIFSNDTPTTPWVSLCANIRHIFHDPTAVRLLGAWESLEWWKIVPIGRNLGAQVIEDSNSKLDLLPASWLRFPRPSPDLGYRLVTSRGNVSLSDFVSTSLYLLSNRLHDPDDGDKGIQLLFLLFEHDPRLFTQILQCDLYTGQAAWENLIAYSRRHHHKRIFRFLLNIGIRNVWLDSFDFGILASALELDCPTDTVVDILDYLCHFGHDHWWRHILNGILAACGKGHSHIANLLVQRFDINLDFINEPFALESPIYPPLSIFLGFVVDFDSNNDGDWHVLDFFLSNGADVDRLLPSGWYIRENSHGADVDRLLPSSRYFREWYNENEINRALRPTVLDLSFRLDRSLFERLAQHSKVPKSALTRTGLLTSLEKGPSTLQEYLKTRVPAHHPLDWQIMRSPLEYLMGDQLKPDWWGIEFYRRNRHPVALRSKLREMDVRTVHGLIQCGVDLNRDSVFLPDIHDLLSEVLRQLRNHVTEDGLQLLDVLVHKGAGIRQDHLQVSVEQKGVGLLKWLQPRVRNFSAMSARALAEAARLNNFEAVEFLLQSGADPNAFIKAEAAKLNHPRGFGVRNMTLTALPQAYSIQAIAAGAGRASEHRHCSLRMSQTLAERGASLVVGPHDSTPFAFTMLLLEYARHDPELFAKVKMVLGTLKQSKQWANPPAFLLELCFGVFRSWRIVEFKERLKIFEYLLDEGADVNPGSPLAALIRAGGPKELVERVLRLGAELNAYTSVYNARWRVEDGTCTPLQAAASQGNEELVRRFLKRGANINSPARGVGGKTALQAACSWNPATEEEHRRKMTICNLLIKGGADINAAPARRLGCMALQEAAMHGDVELTTILVRNGAHVNALSSNADLQDQCALNSAAWSGRLDVAKLLLNANALSSPRGMTGYDGAFTLARFRGHHAFARLIHDHLENRKEQGLDIRDIQKAAEEYRNSGHNTNGEPTDENYRREWDEFSTDSDWSSEDEEPSEYDATEYGTNSEPDDFTSNLGIGIDSTEDIVHVPDSSMGSLTGILDAQALPELQDVANAPTDDQFTYSGMVSVLPGEDMRVPGNEWMLHDPFEAWAGVPDDGALWQQVFEMQDLEFGFATFDASRQLPSSDQLGEPDVDGQDVAEGD